MTYIPDCRKHETYNFDNLVKDSQTYVRGYDHCAEDVVDSFFDNLHVYFDDDSYIMHMLNEKLPESLQDEYEWDKVDIDTGKEVSEKRKVETYADLLRSKLLDWIEDERDTLITALIDSQDDTEESADE
jgi:hypothetical protein